jgi:3(or 17)beta-hydroxysteroid dehydrogenase
MGRVQDKVALVTGAASGIGAACARRLFREGAKVALTDVAADAGRALACELGPGALFLEHDVCDPAAWGRAIDAVLVDFGGLDVLVNNAGIVRNGSVEEQDLETWRAVMAVNADAVFLGCKAAVAAMKGRGGGSIVNISSIHGIMAAPYEAAYSASKGAVRLLTKSVALHCAQAGYRIRCNSVHPGYIETPLVEAGLAASADPQALRAAIEAHHPVGRLGRPDDVAHAVLFLASDESEFVTGSELVVDGGYLLV